MICLPLGNFIGCVSPSPVTSDTLLRSNLAMEESASHARAVRPLNTIATTAGKPILEPSTGASASTSILPKRGMISHIPGSPESFNSATV